MFDFTALILSLKLALVTTIITIIIVTPLACLISFKNFKGKNILKTFISLPLVLPPTVLGFYLLLLLGNNGILSFLHLAFSFQGLVVVSIIFNLPFVFQPIYNSFADLHKGYFEEAHMLSATKLQILRFIIVPLCFRAYISALILGIGHTMGEFGLVLIIGGNIPAKTQVASIAIFDDIEQLNFHSAHINSIILVTISFIIIYSIYTLNKNHDK